MGKRGGMNRRKTGKQDSGMVSLSRKEKRKEERKKKKQEKNLYFARKKLSKLGANPKEPSANPTKPPHSSEIKKEGKEKCSEELKREAEKRRRETEKREEERRLREGRKRQLVEANEIEERNIRRLEKQLRLNKKKNKSLPASFKASGLDYILDVCDSEKLREAVETERTLYDSEFEKDLALVTGRNVPGEGGNKTLKRKEKEEDFEEEFNSDFDQLESQESEMEEVENCVEMEQESDLEEQGSDLEEQECESEEQESDPEEQESDPEEQESDPEEQESGQEEKEEPENKRAKTVGGDSATWEDIYGRKRDSDGNVIVEKGEVWRPRRLREVGNTAGLGVVSKQLKGLLNRLSEANIQSIASQVERLYMSESRHDTNECLTSLLMESTMNEDPAPDSLVLHHAALVAALHANVGIEVGGFILERVVKRTVAMLEEGSRGKELENACTLLAHLYNFKVFECGLVYDLLDRLMTGDFGERELGGILVVLSRAGFSLRKDNPQRLSAFLHALHLASNNHQHNSRWKYMLEVLTLIKNNQREKLERVYDSSPKERLIPLIKNNLVRKGNYVSPLNITLQDLLQANERGKWWVVGSAWRGNERKTEEDKDNHHLAEGAEVTKEVLALASQHRMNTAHRRNIFSIIITAQDYLEAFERLTRLGLKGETERDIVHVLLHCCQHEAQYNPYYAHLAALLCQANRRHAMGIKCGIWERVREVEKKADSHISNLAKFVAFLILEKALPITVLKVMDFGELGKGGVRLVRQIMLTMLVGDPNRSDDDILGVFTRVPTKLTTFRQSLSLFIHHFITKQTDPSSDPVLSRRLQLATQALS